MIRYLPVVLFSFFVSTNDVSAQRLASSVTGTVGAPQVTGAPIYGYNPGLPTGYPAYYNPYNVMYGGYGNPYYSTYQGQYNVGGLSMPVYGAPQLIQGNLYGINYGGNAMRFWRAPSGFYYPWVAGYGYTAYPIFVMPPNNNTPSQKLPPISTLISDLDDYLDKAKEKGKISQADYQSLRLRASDLLSKEKSLSYEEGGTIDSDSESEIRRDIEGLSAEVAHRVKP